MGILNKQLIFTILFFTLLTTFSYAISSGCNPPGTGDWILNGSNVTVCDGETLTINGNISLDYNSSLIINNSDINNSGGLNLLNNSIISIYNSTVIINNTGIIYQNSSFNIINSSFEIELLYLQSTSSGFINKSKLGSSFYYLHTNSSITLINSNFNQSVLIFDDLSKGIIKNSMIYQIRITDKSNVTMINITSGIRIKPECEGISLNISNLYPGSNINLTINFNNCNYFLNISNSNISMFDILSSSSYNMNYLIDNSSLFYVSLSGENVNVSFSNSIIENLVLYWVNECNFINNTYTNGIDFEESGSCNFINLTYLGTPDTNIGGLNNKIINFTTQSSIYKFNLIYSDSKITIDGYLNITNERIWIFSSGATVDRIYPTYIYNSTGSPFVNKPVSVVDISDVVVWNGTTDSNGYVDIVMNYTDSNYDTTYYIDVYGNQLSTINLTSDTPFNLTYALLPHMEVVSISPSGTYDLYQYGSFEYNITTRCVDGDCGDVNLTLDPFEFKNFENDNKNKKSKLSIYEQFQLKKNQDIKGLIIEFNDDSLLEEYLKLKNEIVVSEKKIQSKGKFSITKLYDQYVLKKQKQEFGIKLQDKKVNILTKQESAVNELVQKTNLKKNNVGNHFHTLINGVSLKLNNQEINKLMENSQNFNHLIKSVNIDYKMFITLNESLDVIDVPEVWTQLDGYGDNITGDNITIAIIDTGIDYTHGDLGGCFGAGCKVVGGYDVANSDNDPMDDQGHGTHCAGIAAGNGTLKGVAPDAKLYAYKVLDSSGSGYTSDIIAGVELSMDPNNDSDLSDHVDVISMSLGGSGDPFDSLSQACTNAMKAGVTVVIAAGNDGPNNETISCPGCAPDVITVGATYKNNYPITNLKSSLYVINDSTEVDSTPIENSINATNVTGILLYANYGSVSDFDALNFTDKIALISRGQEYFSDMVENAKNAGCVGIIIHNNYPGLFYGYIENQSNIPAIAVSEFDGEYLYNMSLISNTYMNMSVSSELTIVAEFSSRGPSNIYNKPDILAPGVDICSARLSSAFSDSLCIDNNHAALSGTSMATPHVAGAVALIKQKHLDWNPYQIKSAIEYTANDLGEYRDIQGAGVINVSATINLTHAPPVALINDIPGLTYRE